MHRIALVLLSLASFLALVAAPQSARAQDAEATYAELFQKGIDALNGGQYQEGIELFERCLELAPENATCAYNIACGNALKGEKDQAFEWLQRSAEWGFGMPEGNIDHAETADRDLASLRDDPRFATYIARMRELKTKLDEYVKRPAAIWAPEGAAESERGLLVVLHDAGSTREQVIAGPWRRVAQELGFVLVAPSGTVAEKVDPVDGMSWISSAAEYQERYWIYERPVQDAVSAVRKSHKIDRTRIYIAGEGEGGVVAANIAIGGPGLYKGFVGVDCAVFEPLVEGKAPNAGKMGLRARYVWTAEPEFLRGANFTLDDYAAHVTSLFAKWGVELRVFAGTSLPETDEGEASEEQVAARTAAESAWCAVVVEAVRSLAPQEEGVPVEAGAGSGGAGSSGG